MKQLLSVLLLLGFVSAAVNTANATFYKCVDSDNRITFTDQGCKTDQKEERTYTDAAESKSKLQRAIKYWQERSNRNASVEELKDVNSVLTALVDFEESEYLIAENKFGRLLIE